MADCLWCNIIQGKTQSIKVYEDDSTLAVLDITPANPGQTIVTTKQHAKGLHELSPSDVGKLFAAVRLIVIAQTQVLGCEGVNIVYSLGSIAGQRSDHLIVYVIPRFKNDRVVINWEPKQGNPEEMAKIAGTLSNAIKSNPQVVSAPAPRIIKQEAVVDEEVIKRKPRVPSY